MANHICHHLIIFRVFLVAVVFIFNYFLIYSVIVSDLIGVVFIEMG